MADLPGVVSNALDITISSARRAIQHRSNYQDVFGRPLPTPTYRELQEKQEKVLRGIAISETPLSGSGNWNVNGPINHLIENLDDNTNVPTTASTINKYSDRNLFIYDLVTNEKIKIQFVPQELDYNPESSFVSVASMGRNNPLYHYTGSEDTLEFALDWYATQENREDVILNCKRIEALTKNDGFKNPPHHVKLIWHSKLFSDATWLIVHAPYKLSLFQAHRNMLPQQAIQTLTLKRITPDNSSYDQIRSLTF